MIPAARTAPSNLRTVRSSDRQLNTPTLMLKPFQRCPSAGLAGMFRGAAGAHVIFLEYVHLASGELVISHQMERSGKLDVLLPRATEEPDGTRVGSRFTMAGAAERGPCQAGQPQRELGDRSGPRYAASV